MLTHRAFALAAAAFAVACSAGSGADVASETSPVIGGDPTDAYPDVARITSGCTATLIHPRAMLTAAHCCQRETSCRRVTIGGRTVATTAINHPDFTIAPGGGISPSVDLSILVLAEPVTDVALRRMSSAAPEIGRDIRFVGFGCSAFGGAGSGTKRTGTNEIAFFGANSAGKDEVRFADTFGWRSVPLASLDGGTPNDDANICPGDSGGPTFWMENGAEVVAGVHTLVGAQTGYSCTVSANRPWIDRQLLLIDERVDPGRP